MKVKSFAAILFAAVGLFAIVKGIELIQNFGSAPSIQRLLAEGSTWGSAVMVGIVGLAPVVLFVMGLVLISHPPLRFLNRYASDEGDGPDVKATYESAMRTGLALIGVLLLFWALSPSIELIVTIITSKAPLSWYLRRPFITDAIGVGIRMILGVYLLFGAPDLVRWQMKKILAEPPSEGEPERRDEISDESPST